MYRYFHNSFPRLYVPALCLLLLLANFALADNIIPELMKNRVEIEKNLTLDAFKNLETRLKQNRDHFYISSQLHDSNASGEVFGMLAYDIEKLRPVLTSPREWCNATIVHINIKTCTSDIAGDGNPVVTLYIGNEDYTEPDLADAIQYQFNVESNQRDYFHIVLQSSSGPADTGNYSIDLKVIKLGNNESLVRLNYAMELGFVSRALLKTYLATMGRNKVGFSRLKDDSSNKLEYIGGIEGIMERNTMRYFFAFDAYLSSLTAPPNQRFESAMNHWFDYTEKYRRQLYEIDRPEYLKRKAREMQNQLSLQTSIQRDH